MSQKQLQINFLARAHFFIQVQVMASQSEERTLVSSHSQRSSGYAIDDDLGDDLGDAVDSTEVAASVASEVDAGHVARVNVCFDADDHPQTNQNSDSFLWKVLYEVVTSTPPLCVVLPPPSLFFLWCKSWSCCVELEVVGRVYVHDLEEGFGSAS
jgi:hypothetical protein